MIFPAKMKHLTVVALKKDSDQVTNELLKIGVLHFMDVREVDSNLDPQVVSFTPKVQVKRIFDIRRHIENLFELIEYTPKIKKSFSIDNANLIDIDKIEKDILNVSNEINDLREKQKNIQSEIMKLKNIQHQLSLFGNIDFSINNRSKYSFLNIKTGSILIAQFDNFINEFSNIPSVVIKLSEDNKYYNVLCISMKKEESIIKEILNKYGWRDVSIENKLEGSSKEEIFNNLNNKLSSFKSDQKKLSNDIKETINKNKSFLHEKWSVLRASELFNKIQSNFRITSKSVVFTGWIPDKYSKEVEKKILKTTKEKCFIEFNSPEKLEKKEKKKFRVPVLFTNPKFLSPFQWLVSSYSIPEYKTVDPTPIVAILYLIMFGLMFGDAGQGLVIMLIGIFGLIFYKKKKSSILNLFKLIIWCGASAIIFGILFNSYFGMALFKPLWFDYHGLLTHHNNTYGFVKSIDDVLILTLYFGIGIIIFGLILNWINIINKKKWEKLIFDKNGIFGSIMYFFGIYAGYYFVMHKYKELPDIKLILIFLGVPSLIFLFKPILKFIQHKKHDTNVKFSITTPIIIIMEGLIELLEIFTSYLSNTLSFMRVAALGIAHVSLMITFFEIAKMASGEGSNIILYYLIVVIGNIFVIILEGLSAGIQSLRLNYYEFFSKYFSPNGVLYTPVSLK